MATSKAQRIGIGVIAAVMFVGTIGSFFVVIIANKNSQSDQQDMVAQQQKLQKQQEEQQKQAAETQKKQAAEAVPLSAKYYDTFSQYASRVQPFTPSKVTNLEKDDLRVGDGEEVKEDTDYRAYYIGWNPSGKVFDESIDGNALKYPIEKMDSLITGWKAGVIGMKMGGVREITIPSEMAYGNQSPSADIPKNTPLKFVIMVIPNK